MAWNTAIAAGRHVIAANNRNLSDDVCAGKFHEELSHRLDVVTLESSPLGSAKSTFCYLRAISGIHGQPM
jgi:DNA-binding NtrC family response regulator